LTTLTIWTICVDYGSVIGAETAGAVAPQTKLLWEQLVHPAPLIFFISVLVSISFCVFPVSFCVLLFLIAPFMSYFVYFQQQMLVHLCLSVLLTVISLIDFICTVTYELM